MKRVVLAAALFGLAAASQATVADAATLKAMTTLHGPSVLLSDLFDDAGANAGRVLGPGPAPGGRIVVEAPQLAAIAKQFGAVWKPGSTADRAVLEWPGRPLGRDEAVAALRDALIAAGVPADCDIDLPGFSPPLVPFDVEAKPAVSQLDYDRASGRFTAALSVAAPGMGPINLRLAGHVDETIEVPVATARLAAGSVLRAEDVHMARVRTGQLRGEVVHQPAEAIGMQLRRQILAGQPLAVADLGRPTLVQRGATVLMQLDSPGIALTAQGQAMEAGAIGERIRVLNPVSGAVVEAEVLAPDRVRVMPGALPLTSKSRRIIPVGEVVAR